MRRWGGRLLWLVLVAAVLILARDWQTAPSLPPGRPAPAPAAKAPPAPDPAPGARRFTLCQQGGGRNCVIDGDTFRIDGRRVRLAGIDAPEIREPKCDAERALAVRAQVRLHALLNAGPVALVRAGSRDLDPNGRLLREAMVNGRPVSRVLIAEGLARRYEGRKRGWC